MSKKRRGLGRGLDALLQQTSDAGVSLTPQEANNDAFDRHSDNHAALHYLPIEWLQPGQYQPRRDIQPEALEELAASIKAQGLMQPIVVRSIAPERYEIIAGERRWRACQLAAFDKVPALIRDVSDTAAMAMALIENIQRENLNPMEEALALSRLQQALELTQQEVADAVGKNRVTIANLLRLLKLNDDVKRLLEHGDLEMGHARALLGLEGSAQSDAAQQVISKAMNVRQTEALVRTWQQDGKVKKEPVRQDPDINRLQQILGDRLGTNVDIKHTTKGKGKLVISYNSVDELEGILNHIK